MSPSVSEYQESLDSRYLQHSVSVPNQPHLLNKYQINMEFSHFHEFGILSGMYILAPYQIDIVKGCGFCNGNIILIRY